MELQCQQFHPNISSIKTEQLFLFPAGFSLLLSHRTPQLAVVQSVALSAAMMEVPRSVVDSRATVLNVTNLTNW